MRSPNLLNQGSAAINMTPMIDVVFLLIIFFLVSSHLAKRENSLPLDLPKATAALDDNIERDTVVVNVLDDGSWQVAGNPTDESRLNTYLRRRAMASADALRLKIRTDQEVPYERIEPVLRAASSLGIGDIVFSVYEDRTR